MCRGYTGLCLQWVFNDPQGEPRPPLCWVICSGSNSGGSGGNNSGGGDAGIVLVVGVVSVFWLLSESLFFILLLYLYVVAYLSVLFIKV